jgi:dolichol-phosphate mannosyltransferase
MAADNEKTMGRFSIFAKQTFKFYLVGGLGVIVNLGLLYFLTDVIGVWYILSQGMAIAVSITTNFTLHKFWTYKKEITEAKTFERYIKFIIISLVGMGIQLGLTYGLVENLSMYYLHAAVLSITIASLFNYFANRKWTFGIKF